MNTCPTCKSTKMEKADNISRKDWVCVECGQQYGPERYHRMTRPTPFIESCTRLINRLYTYPMYRRFRKQNISVGKGISLGKGFKFLWGNMIVGDYVGLQNTFCDDSAMITIGSHTFFGHNVKLLTPYHDMNKLDEQRQKTVKCKPIHIGKGVWIATNTIILAGVTVGDGAVVGAGSVVTKDIESSTFAGGSPAKVIRRLQVS